MRRPILSVGLGAALLLCGSSRVLAQAAAPAAAPRIERAILISLDGMHAVDLALYVAANPQSTLAALAKRGVTYPNARTPLLGDSSPGLLSLATGGSPAVTGIIYSPTYDRTLSPPTSKDCADRGTVIYIDEKPVKDNTREDSGGGIDPEKLPRDPAKGCTPVYPRQLVRVNTMFEVVKRHGGRTAWIDQHDAYNDMLLGASGAALDDSRSLERRGSVLTFDGVTGQDGRRLELLLNQIRGNDSYGRKATVPTLFGMGFISVSVLQKSEGYPDASGRPGNKDLKRALDFVDRSLGRIVAELTTARLVDSTLIVISSKHGQSPIDLTQRRLVNRGGVRDAINGVQDGLLAHASLDAIGLVWLKDSSRTEEAAAALRARQSALGIQKIYWGEASRMLVASPAEDPRAPDIVFQPELGVFYTENADSDAAKLVLAEHGGMLDEDTNVVTLVSFAGGTGVINRAHVQTSQVAPTILAALGIDPSELDAVQKEGTTVLPGLPWSAFRAGGRR